MRSVLVLLVLASIGVAAPADAAKKRRATQLSERTAPPTIHVEQQRVKGRSQKPMVVIEIPREPPAFEVGTSGVAKGSRKLPRHRGR